MIQEEKELNDLIQEIRMSGAFFPMVSKTKQGDKYPHRWGVRNKIVPSNETFGQSLFILDRFNETEKPKPETIVISIIGYNRVEVQSDDHVQSMDFEQAKEWVTAIARLIPSRVTRTSPSPEDITAIGDKFRKREQGQNQG